MSGKQCRCWSKAAFRVPGLRLYGSGPSAPVRRVITVLSYDIAPDKVFSTKNQKKIYLHENNEYPQHRCIFCGKIKRSRVWLGVVKVLCILHHWGLQLILAYSRARPAILVAGKGRGGMFFYFFCFYTFIPVPLSSLSLSFISFTVSVSFLPFSGRRHKMTHKSWRVIKP